MIYDIIIIGAGSAGISAYKQAVKHTDNILIINHGPWDTTCARVGCMPSKLLISSANRLHDAQTLENVGLQANLKVDTSNVMSRVRKYRDHFTSAVLEDVNSWKDKHKINGIASFIDKSTIQVNNQTYQAKSFILAVGSEPRRNEEWEKIGNRLLTSDTIFELEQLPQSIAVIGSGSIATELAEALYHLGVEVTIFSRSSHIAIATSPKIQSLIQENFNQKLNIHFETTPTSLTKEKEWVCVKYKNRENQNEEEIKVEYVLNATGRTSLLSSLKLENIESNFSDIKNLPVDNSTKQLKNYPIFIVGDAYTTTPVQHEASYEGKISVNNCLSYPNVNDKKTYPPLSIVFSSPEIAVVGKSYKQLKDAGQKFTVGFASYTDQGRATVLGKNIGGIEVYFDSTTQEFLGAEIYVTEAEHLAHLLAWSLSEKANLKQLLSKPYYHPTLEEGLRTSLRDAYSQLKSSD